MSDATVQEYEEGLHQHPTPKQYVQVAIVLALITALEVAIYYIRSMHSLLVPLLLFFSFIKFALVALWFMHLRFDSRVFRRFFILGIVLALIVFGVVLVTFFARGGATPAG